MPRQPAAHSIPDDPEADHDLLTREEEQALFARLRAGDRSAADLIARGNIRLVISIARRYWRRRRKYVAEKRRRDARRAMERAGRAAREVGRELAGVAR